MPYFSITANDKGIGERVELARKVTGDPKPIVKEMLEIMLLSTDERFEKEEDPQGNPWQKLSGRRAAEKRQKRLINKTLQATGRGRASINSGMRGNSGYIGTNVDYMAKHHRGKGVPKREIFGVSEQDRKDFGELLSNRLPGSPRPKSPQG